MVCSGKGGSKWLDRLRSSKDSSSSSSSSIPMDHSSSSSPSSLNPKPAGAGAGAGAGAASSSSSSSFAVITGILSDLFYITPTTTTVKKKKKKFPRKQASPKNLSNPKQQQHRQQLPPPPPRTVSDSSPPIHNHNHKQQQQQQQQRPLSGFSKTEVTVIDTSSLLWKSDKLIFRRKHVWKIKDKNTTTTNKTNFLPHQQIQEYNAEQHCSGPEMSANAPHSSNDKEQNASTPLQQNHSYDPQKKC